MNIVQIREKIAFLNDRTASSRFEDYQYDEAIQSAVQQIIRDRFDDIKKDNGYSFERVQKIIDELNVLVQISPVIVPVNNIIQRSNFPANYREFLLCENTISGQKMYSKPLSHAELPNEPFNPFVKASVDWIRIYHTFDSRGIEIRFDKGTFTAAQITYLREPAIPTLGLPNNKITGPGAIVIGTDYYVLNDCDVNGTLYYVGQRFTAASINLISGTVIAVANTVDTDLPVQLHEEICRIASATMQGTIEDYNKVNMLQNENVKN